MAQSTVIEGVVKSCQKSKKQRFIPGNLKHRFPNELMWVSILLRVDLINEEKPVSFKATGEPDESMSLMLEAVFKVEEATEGTRGFVRVQRGEILYPTYGLSGRGRSFVFDSRELRETRRFCVEIFKPVSEAFMPCIRKSKGKEWWVSSHGSQIWVPNGDYDIVSNSEEEVEPIATFEAEEIGTTWSVQVADHVVQTKLSALGAE